MPQLVCQGDLLLPLERRLRPDVRLDVRVDMRFKHVSACIVMAYIVMAYIVMAQGVAHHLRAV